MTPSSEEDEFLRVAFAAIPRITEMIAAFPAERTAERFYPTPPSPPKAFAPVVYACAFKGTPACGHGLGCPCTLL